MWCKATSDNQYHIKNNQWEVGFYHLPLVDMMYIFAFINFSHPLKMTDKCVKLDSEKDVYDM